MKIITVLFFLYFMSLHISLAALETLLWLVLLPSIIIAAKRGQLMLPSKWILGIFGGLLGTAIVSFVLNIGELSEFTDYIGEFRWMLAYLGWLQFYNLFFSRLSFPKLILTGQATLVIAGFYSLYQFFAGQDPFRPRVVFHYLYEGSRYFRPNSFFGLPTTYAYASAMFFSLSLAFWLREPRAKDLFSTVVRRLYLFMSPLNIFLTFTRAAWLAFIATTSMILAQVNRRLMIRVGLSLGLLATAFYSSFPSFRHRVNSIVDPAYTANSSRLYLWKANLMIWEEYPFFGIGFDENRKQIDGYLNRLNQPDVMRNHPHNSYINFLAGLGIFGLIFFLLLVGYHLKITIEGLRKTDNHLHKTLYLGTLGLQMVLLIGAFTECTFEDLELTHQYILFIALMEFLDLKYLRDVQSA